MLSRLALVVRELAAFFRSAVFTAFFFGPTKVRLIAWTGAFLLVALAAVNAFTAYYLSTLIKAVGDMCQGSPSNDEVISYIFPFVLVFTWLFIIEPINEVGKMYYVVKWTQVVSRWFSDKWIASHKRLHFGEMPVGTSEIVVDRVAEIIEPVLDLIARLCRAMVILGSFGYMSLELSRALWPWLATYVPGWLLLALIVWAAAETFGSGKIGRMLPDLLDYSRRRRALLRSHLEEFEKTMKQNDVVSMRERVRIRKEARSLLNHWLDAYVLTFRHNLKLLTWKSGNQQACQFTLIAVLGLLTAAKFFSLGTSSATVYAVNEIRGALLTISNSWLIIVKIQSLMKGLHELELTVMASPREAASILRLEAAE